MASEQVKSSTVTQDTQPIPNVQILKFVKILSEDLKHNGFQYKEGMNVDTKPFDNNFNSSFGYGLYFTTNKLIYDYLSYGPLIADVTVPLDANVVQFADKFRADRIYISNIRRWDRELDLEKALNNNGSAIKHIQNPSDELLLMAIRRNARNIQYIKNPTDEMKLAAIKQNTTTIQYIKDSTRMMRSIFMS
jgi:hypothetical protein